MVPGRLQTTRVTSEDPAYLPIEPLLYSEGNPTKELHVLVVCGRDFIKRLQINLYKSVVIFFVRFYH